MDAGKDKMYANRPIFYNISKVPQYLTTNFRKIPNLSELLLAFTFKKTCYPTLKYLEILFLSE
jgi:hypothetical protein